MTEPALDQEQDWSSLSHQEKNKVLLTERWDSRAKMAESMISAIDGLMHQFNFSDEEIQKYRGYLQEILLNFHKKYDEAVIPAEAKRVVF